MSVWQTLKLGLLAMLVLGLTLYAGGCDQWLGSGDAPTVSREATLSAAEYMPLTTGRTLVYQTPDGGLFTLTFTAPRAVPWFDGSVKEVIPVRDTRCGCQVLYSRGEGQVQAVGTIHRDEMDHWGEYMVVYPGDGKGDRDPVTTPAGRFENAVRIDTAEGSAWFAPGVGIVKTDQFVLVAADATY